MSFLDAALDASVVFSFDRTGFRRHARAFAAADLDVRLDGKVCLVTGANSGIGRAAALELARRGAAVRLVCRSEARGREALDAIARETGNRDLRLDVLDVSDLDLVRRYAASLVDDRVDVLVHNAGVLPDERALTPDGLELTFATHVVGPYVLTLGLEDRLRRAAPSRVIFVSSGGMYTQRLSLDDVDWSRRPYDGVTAYAQTKRMQVVLAELLAERWRDAGVSVHAMHPGWADTPAVRSSLPRFWRLTRRILRTPAEGADTVVWLAASAAALAASGSFWFDRRPRPTHLLRRTAEPPGERLRLLEACERAARSS